MVDVGEPTQNGFAERMMRTIKEGGEDLSDYQDFQEYCRNMDRFLNDVYMFMSYLTPVEF